MGLGRSIFRIATSIWLVSSLWVWFRYGFSGRSGERHDPIIMSPAPPFQPRQFTPELRQTGSHDRPPEPTEAGKRITSDSYRLIDHNPSAGEPG
jgi:hypothetical protein